MDLEKLPAVKVVFAIRSDQLSHLHELSDRIPGILRNRYELKGLRREQAAEAPRPCRMPASIVRPLRLNRRPLKTFWTTWVLLLPVRRKERRILSLFNCS